VAGKQGVKLMITLKEIVKLIWPLCFQPLSTQDDVATSLSDYGIPTFAISGVRGECRKHLSGTSRVLKPQILPPDDGLDLG